MLFNNESIFFFFIPLDQVSEVTFQSDTVRKNQTMKPGYRHQPCCSKLLVSWAYWQNQCFTNSPLETASHHPSRRRKKHRKLFKSKTQQPRGICALRGTPNLVAKHHAQTKLANFPLTNYVFINPNCPHPGEPFDNWVLCAGWGRENSRGLFHGFMGPYFMGISYSVVQVIFKAASHPLIPLSSPHLTIG